MTHRLAVLALATITMLALPGAAIAQVAVGTTTQRLQPVESTPLPLAWSARKTLLGKSVFNEHGQKIGEVEDLIVAPDHSVSCVILGAGGFVGLGRHDVAVPMTQIRERGGRLVMAGATPDTIQRLPAFDQAIDVSRRAQFRALAGRDIAQGRIAMAHLERSATMVRADTKAHVGLQIASLQLALDAAEIQLAGMMQADASRWRDFEAELAAATARLRETLGHLDG